MIVSQQIALLLVHVALAFGGIAEQIHKGIDIAVQSVMDGAIEVTGTPANPKDITFALKTLNGRQQVCTADSVDFSDVADFGQKIFFLVHGWMQNSTTCHWYEPMTEVLLHKYPGSHIIQIDWGKSAQQSYSYAAFSTQSVGEIIANGLQKLLTNSYFPFPLRRVVFIGHSLGSQVLGWMSKKYQILAHKKLTRIIALDPSGPIFNTRPDSRKLNRQDAEVVMVIHTDNMKFGSLTSCGTIDFFPNGGKNQPGCSYKDQKSYKDLPYPSSSNKDQRSYKDLSYRSSSYKHQRRSNSRDPTWCSHNRAPELFIEALKYPSGFMSKKCDLIYFEDRKCNGMETVSLGDWETYATGSFYLETSGRKPFIKYNKNNGHLDSPHEDDDTILTTENKHYRSDYY